MCNSSDGDGDDEEGEEGGGVGGSVGARCHLLMSPRGEPGLICPSLGARGPGPVLSPEASIHMSAARASPPCLC